LECSAEPATRTSEWVLSKFRGQDKRMREGERGRRAGRVEEELSSEED